MKKILIGGSPCTKWSIAQRERETKPEGEGWELFKNYLCARDKYKPDFFLYENNKSMSDEIRAQITREFGFEPVLINSALVSAQNRRRLYWVGKREKNGSYSRVDVEQPDDRGLLLRDVLDGYCDCEKNDIGSKTSEVLNINPSGKGINGVVIHTNCKSRTLTTNKGEGQKIIQPIRVGCLPSPDGTIKNSQANRIYSIDGKAVNQVANGGGLGAKTGLYAVPLCVAQRGRYVHTDERVTEQHYEVRTDGKTNTLTTVQKDNMVCEAWDGKTYPVYEVKNGKITIKGKTHPIKLPDGLYIIRKLSVAESCRLQTLPVDYCHAVSDSQAYKGLGNGWTAEVIVHIMQTFMFDIPKNEPLQVLSMYDGIGTGFYCLKKLGFQNIEYHAYEIDKYAIKVANSNHQAIIQHGNAFALRDENWRLE